jgi:chorismate synthase
VSTIAVPQQSVSKNLQEITLMASGRHDPCVLPRAVPIVEAMAAIVITDHLLRNKLY